MVLTPQLRQRIEMLQMTSLELAELVEQEMVVNPILEEVQSGDEMQDLAEAFNDMTAKISVTYADLEGEVQERSRQLVRSERLASGSLFHFGRAALQYPFPRSA